MRKAISIPSKRLSLNREAFNVVSVHRGWCSLAKPSWMRIQNPQRKRFVTALQETCVAVRVTFRLFRPSKQPAASNRAGGYRGRVYQRWEANPQDGCRGKGYWQGGLYSRPKDSGDASWKNSLQPPSPRKDNKHRYHQGRKPPRRQGRFNRIQYSNH